MQSFQTILFAADFSDNSKEAFRAACSLAVENETRLVVLHVAEPTPVPQEPVYYGQLTVQFLPADPDKARHDQLKQKLRDLYAPDFPLDVAYRINEGKAAEEILRVAGEIGADLIVMGTHGRTGLRWLVAGSVAVAVLHRATCPVLALRSNDQPREAKEMQLILHPTDFSADSEAALRVARRLARERGARLIIEHVEKFEVLVDGTPAAVIDPRADHDALENVRKRVDGPDLKYPVETLLRQGYAADEIVLTAQEMSCDLIVMGTHGRTGMSRLLMGSVAENVLPKANCPVLLVKASQRVTAPSYDRAATTANAIC
jgi:nucleotide-binding universal stress UspA family protein